MSDLREFLLKSFRANPAIFPGVDILNVPFHSPESRLGVYCAILATIVDRDRGRPAVDKFVLILPPETNLADWRTAATTEFDATFHSLAGRTPGPAERRWFHSRLRLVAATDRRHQSALSILRDHTSRTAMVVTDAANYRDQTVPPLPGTKGSTLPEDIWVPQLRALATAAVDVARSNEVYVLLDTNRPGPSRTTLADLLLSVDDHWGVIQCTNDDSLEHILATRAATWGQWLRNGQLGRALHDVQRLPSATDVNKEFLRLQLHHRTGFYSHLLPDIRRLLESAPHLDISSRLRLARMASDTDAASLAQETLTPILDQLVNLEDLKEAVSIARKTRSTNLETQAAQRLQTLYGDSTAATELHLRALRFNRDYGTLADLTSSDPDRQVQARVYAIASQHLPITTTPNYSVLLGSVQGDEQLMLRQLCVEDALHRQLFHHAINLAMPVPGTPPQTESLERLLVQVLESLLTRPQPNARLPLPNDTVSPAFRALTVRLASNPRNQRLRADLERLVEPRLAGTNGIQLFLAVMLELASRSTSVRPRGPGRDTDATWFKEHQDYLAAANHWLDAESPLILGRPQLPNHLTSYDPHTIVSAIASLLEHFPINSEADARAAMGYLTLGVATAPLTSSPCADLELIDIAAGRLATSGHPQLARNLAEHALNHGADTPTRRRRAWLVAADTYQRCGNYLVGTVYMACCFAADDTVDRDQLCLEVFCLLRLLRDSGLKALFDEAMDNARRTLRRTGDLETYSHRLATLQLQTRQKSPPGNPAIEPVSELVSDATHVGIQVLDRQDDPEPVAAVLAQSIARLKQLGAPIPTASLHVFNQLRDRVRGDRMRTLVDAWAAPDPTPNQLFALSIQPNSKTLYSDDVGYDDQPTAILARRVLAAEQITRNPPEACFVIEQLTDHGIAVPQWDASPTPASALSQDIEEPARMAATVSESGLNIVQAAFDTNGQLVRVAAVNGRLQTPVREAPDVISASSLRAWASEYPYQYAYADPVDNAFYTTTSNLRFSEIPSGPTLLVADTELQSFPPNLLYVDGDFAGRTRPMSSAPSLAWLKAARSKGLIGDGRICVWIPCSTSDHDTATLSMIARRLTGTFKTLDATVDHAPQLPNSVTGATIAVVAAHGGVHPEGRYFQVVSDDHQLRAPAGALANALRNVGLAILFVCSGARSDSHPAARTTIGLARQVLDRGCCAVVASPWPLDAKVPPLWLPEFFRHWSTGTTLAQACFNANQLVDSTFSYNPAHGLAMTVFGNPELRFNNT